MNLDNIELATKHCWKCNRVLPLSEFYKNRSKSDGLAGWCRDCSKTHTAAFRAEHPLYTTWMNHRQLCNRPNYPGYHRYGGRGIKVAPEWNTQQDFLAFEMWVYENIGPRPSSSHHLDRIDNDGDFAPGNLQWSTPGESQRNKECSKDFTGICTRLLFDNGEMMNSAVLTSLHGDPAANPSAANVVRTFEILIELGVRIWT